MCALRNAVTGSGKFGEQRDAVARGEIDVPILAFRRNLVRRIPDRQ